MTRLYHSLHTVLDQAIKDITAANGDELSGELKDLMQVHGKKGEGGKNEKIGGPGTYYTEEQELFT